MKIVSYNVNGLRPRVASHGSLRKLLDSLQADIVCFQETKLSRQELSADITVAEGYESFFSCTRTTRKGRIRYSGVATFCKVNMAFSSTEVTLPLAVDEGISGMLKCSGVAKTKETVNEVGYYEVIQGSEYLTRQELLKLDSEGRCIITDHGHFVLFNIYGPFVQSNDSERLQFKLNFFKVLQRRLEALLGQGRRVLLMGDFNIAPFRIDSCDPGPDFEENMFRKWLRTLMKDGGGPFTDAFRFFHPYRKEAYTCWSQVSGAEEFNFGTRIDHILVAGPCLHQDANSEQDEFIHCDVEACDILSHFKRTTPDNARKWHGGRSIKLEGSDHAPVYIKLRDMPDVVVHDVPALATRYMPEVSGRQQSIVSLIQKRRVGETEVSIVSDLSIRNTSAVESSQSESYAFSNGVKKQVETPLCNTSVTNSCGPSLSSIQQSVSEFSEGRNDTQTLKKQCLSVSKDLKNAWDECFKVTRKQIPLTQNSQRVQRKRKNESKSSQCSLRSFFVPNSTKALKDVPDRVIAKDSKHQICEELHESDSYLDPLKEQHPPPGKSGIESSLFSINCSQEDEKDEVRATYEKDEDEKDVEPFVLREKEKAKTAALEWQKIQRLMSRTVPLCNGHAEPCVSRVVKKAGPNIGHGFYVCARAKGPASNPEARCNHFEWANLKGKSRGK